VNIRVVAVGRLKEGFWRDACAEYLKRLGAYASLEVREVEDRDPGKAGGVPAALAKEGAAVLGAIPERSYVILLAIEGRELSSEEFSSRLDALALEGRSDVTFIVGGPNGVDGRVRARADEALSFGPMTLPHNLARVVLLEQLYRAFKISRNEPYHK